MESGIDFNRADIVIQYGVASDETKTIQQAGRGGRDSDNRSLFLIMYEPWVMEVDISNVPAGELEEDPDRPFCVDGKKYQNKISRTSIHCIRTIQCLTCICSSFTTYLQDKTPEGQLIPLLYVMHTQQQTFSMRFCHGILL